MSFPERYTMPTTPCSFIASRTQNGDGPIRVFLVLLLHKDYSIFHIGCKIDPPRNLLVTYPDKRVLTVFGLRSPFVHCIQATNTISEVEMPTDIQFPRLSYIHTLCSMTTSGRNVVVRQ
jgi:hypothetical protein